MLFRSVQDLDELYSSIRVVCCPLFSGGGTRIKIIEAAFYGRPVVSTSVGAEGLAFVDRNDIWLANSEADFAKACAALLEDNDLACEIGSRARQRALKTLAGTLGSAMRAGYRI